MDIVPAAALRGLKYLELLSETDTGVSGDHLDAFVRWPNPRLLPKLVDYNPYWDDMGDFHVKQPESATTYFIAMGWAYADTDSEEIRITTIGKAFAYAAMRDPAATDSAPIVVRIDPSDPVAYARVFAAIDGMDDVMVVDPYLREAELFDLAGVPSVTRVLTSRKGKLDKSHVASLVTEKARFDVRFLDNELHDRWLIPKTGPLRMLGSSLNSIDTRPGVIVPLSEPAAVGAVRKDYDELWEKATPAKPSGETSPA